MLPQDEAWGEIVAAGGVDGPSKKALLALATFVFNDRLKRLCSPSEVESPRRVTGCVKSAPSQVSAVDADARRVEALVWGAPLHQIAAALLGTMHRLNLMIIPPTTLQFYRRCARAHRQDPKTNLVTH